MRERRALELVLGAYAGILLVPAGALWVRASGGDLGDDGTEIAVTDAGLGIDRSFTSGTASMATG